MDEIRVCDGFSLGDLNDFQYLDSGVGVDLFRVGFSFGFTGNVLEIDLSSAISELC